MFPGSILGVKWDLLFGQCLPSLGTIVVFKS